MAALEVPHKSDIPQISEILLRKKLHTIKYSLTPSRAVLTH